MELQHDKASRGIFSCLCVFVIILVSYNSNRVTALPLTSLHNIVYCNMAGYLFRPLPLAKCQSHDIGCDNMSTACQVIIKNLVDLFYFDGP